MKKKNWVCLGIICFLLVGSSIFLFSRKADAGQNFDQTRTYAELTKENPFVKPDTVKAGNVDLYAKGEHVFITNEEIKWQTEVFELTDSKEPEADAYASVCKFKTLFYNAVENGFLASDEELDKAIEFNVENYELGKQEGDSDALYESYGGAQNYEDAMREVTRKSLSIENYMKSLKDDFAKDFTEDEIYMGELETKWADKRLEIEKKLVEQEKFKKV